MKKGHLFWHPETGGKATKRKKEEGKASKVPAQKNGGREKGVLSPGVAKEHRGRGLHCPERNCFRRFEEGKRRGQETGNNHGKVAEVPEREEGGAVYAGKCHRAKDGAASPLTSKEEESRGVPLKEMEGELVTASQGWG